MHELEMAGFTVDEETGEVFDTQDVKDPITETLPRLARAIRYLSIERQMNDDYRDAEVERIEAVCKRKREGLTQTIDTLIERAKLIMQNNGYGADTDKKAIHYPGLARLRFGKTRVTVDDSGWANVGETTRAQSITMFPKLFAVEQKIKPIKKAIKEYIEANPAGNLPGFKLSDQTETFVFKAE